MNAFKMSKEAQTQKYLERPTKTAIKTNKTIYAERGFESVQTK